jgi:4-amino-4-deoxy-L-arabinose transferase-like glycosyltransferase
MKYFKIGIYEIYAFAIIIFGTLLRVLLAALKWPLLNSDEGTMGIMALHIAYRGEHPIFYYGQNYMGTLDAYIGAGLFQVFGSSIFTLRLGVILLYVLFMVAMYFLTSALYTKRLALASLVLLSLGSIPILIMEMSPIVYPEILFFGAFAFLLASWLTLSYNQDVSQRKPWLRLLGYACWGCVAGLAIWSDPLILPYLVAASLLLVVFCWRELILKLGGISLLLGLVVGASPLVMYNLKAPSGQDSLSIFLGQTHPVATVPGSLAPLSMHIVNTLLFNIPPATGNPLCSLVFSQGPVNTPGLRCAIVHASWSLGLIVLWLVAVFLALMALLKLKHYFRQQLSSSEQKRTIIRESARLMLLVSAGITLLFFTLSASSIPSSAGNSRYLHCLLISIPAFIWPLWIGARTVRPPEALLTKIKVALSRGMLLLIFIAFLAGTIAAFLDIHAISSIDQQNEAVLNKLESMDIKHFYTDDYWTCYRIAFASREKITCAVIGSDLLPSKPNRNRYWPYVLQVQADPHAAYLLSIKDPQTTLIMRNAHLTNGNYLNVELYGYVIYQPV